jgi:hypothetical protein
MSTHRPDPTDRRAVCGLSRMPTAVVTTASIKPPLEATISAQFENDLQTLLAFNPSEERDSLAEHLAALLRPNCDVASEAAQALARLRELLESNHRERGHEHTATGHLSLLHRTLHTGGQRAVHGLSVIDAARRLRTPLRIVKQARDARRPADRPDWQAFMHASWAIKDVAGLLPADALRGSYLRHELGAGPHDLLLEILDAHLEPVA